MAAVGRLEVMKLRCIALFILLMFTAGALQASQPRVIVVFPLENMSGNASVGWMSEGIAELLTTRLASPTRYVLQRSERDQAYEELKLPLETSLTLASEYKVAKALGVTVAVVGHFSLKDGRLMTQAQWLNLSDLSLSHPIVVTGKLDDLDALETRLAWKLLSSQAGEAPAKSEAAFANRFPPVRLGAFESYIRGILSTDPRDEIHFLQESNRLDPLDHRASFALGQYYFGQNDYANSTRWLQKLNSGDRNYAESLFLLGIDLYHQGHDNAAEVALRKLAGRVPLGEVFNNLGVVELHLGKAAEALGDFKQAFKKSPDDSDYAFNMGLALWRLRKYDQVPEYIHRVLAEEPDDLDAHVLLAEVSGELGDAAARKTQLEWVSEHENEDGADPPADNNSNKGEHVAPKLSPRIKTDYDVKAFHLLALERTRAVQKRLAQQSAEAVQSEGTKHIKQGLDLLAAGRVPDAERELSQAVLLLPQSSQAHLALGEVYQREGRHTLAATEFETSLKEKDSYEAHLWLARAYVSLDHLEPALKQVQVAQKLQPASSEAKELAKQIRKQLSLHSGKP